MPKIEKIHAREILDSRGNPTVAVRVALSNGISASASVPSGASTGIHEALELRDGDKNRYGGKGVLRAIANVNGPIAKALRGHDVFDQRGIDEAMVKLDGTENKSHFGANAILGVSLAAVHAGAKAADIPLYKYLRQAFGLKYRNYLLPQPTMNVLNGGRHAGWALDIQECMIIPKAKSFCERVRIGAEIFAALGKLLEQNGFSTLKGDEGGYAPSLKSNEDAFKYLSKAVESAGYVLGKDVNLGIDAAASEYYDAKSKKYSLKLDKKILSSAEMMDFYSKWMEKYPIISFEDPLAEDDWEAWKKITDRFGKKITLVGDDLFVTNVKRLERGIKLGVANAILIKVNQIGSLSETIDAILLAQKNNYKIAVSHRSGETADTTIADLAVAVNAEFIKTGSLSRSERVEKYNRLMEIEGELQSAPNQD
ncbi:MAG: phosphopyruvate hydratase [Patescibacteria group bacterium]